MGRGQAGKAWELRLLREEAGDNYQEGLKEAKGGYANRLQEVAKRTGRSYAAVRKKAHESDAVSCRPGAGLLWTPPTRRDTPAKERQGCKNT